MKAINNKEDILNRIYAYLDHANEEEVNVLSMIMNGLEKKQQGEYLTYLAGITNLKSQFIGEDTYEVIIPIQPMIENPLKIVHGGITATLIDTAMGSLVNRLLPDELAAVTTEMKINYISPGIGKHLRCIASVAHKGRQIWIAEAKVYSDKNKLVAMANGSFFIIPRKR